MTKAPAPRRGRPPLAWLDVQQLRALPIGTAVVLDMGSAHNVTGRIASFDSDCVEVETVHADDAVNVPLLRVVRARVVSGLYLPGDPVLKRHVPASEWRGGVVRVRGREVCVEQIDGSWVWLDESVIEPPQARDRVAPVPA